ncbi:MAG: TrmB family transcriptional regulator [Candidatus Dormibacteria bacterium]
MRADEDGAAAGNGGGGRRGGPKPPPLPDLDLMSREFEEVGLSAGEARLLPALLSAGSGTAATLSGLARMPQTNAYAALKSLTVKRLAEQLPGKVAAWASPGRDEVLERLGTLHRERLRYLEERVERTREVLAQTLPETALAPLPYVHLLPDAGKTKTIYDELLARAEHEVLTFSKPPYVWTSGNPDQANLDALDRIERGRAIYEADALLSSNAGPAREELAVYMAAGLDARVGAQLPYKLVVIDRKVALVSMTEPGQDGRRFPTYLLIEHAGFAAGQALVFEHHWDVAAPYPGRNSDTCVPGPPE